MGPEPRWALAGSLRFPCSVHILLVAVGAPGPRGACGSAPALCLPPGNPSGQRRWALSARWTGPAALSKSLLLDGGFCAVALPSRKEEGERGSSFSLRTRHPVWLLGQLVLLGFYLDGEPIASRGRRENKPLKQVLL